MGEAGSLVAAHAVGPLLIMRAQRFLVSGGGQEETNKGSTSRMER